LILLITFAFLFVVAAALAAMSYSQMDKSKKELVSAESNMEEQAQTIKDAKRNHRDLTFIVTGSAQGRHADVMGLGEAPYMDENVKAAIADSRGGLAPDMKKLAKLLASSKAKIKELERELEVSNETIGKRDAASTELSTAHSDALANNDKEMKTLRVEVNTTQDAVADAIASGAEDLKKQRAQLNIEIQAREKRIQELSGKYAELGAIVRNLKVIIKELQGEDAEAMPDLEPDGKIVKIAEDDEICYINVGSEKGIKPGMTFAISPVGQNIAVERDAKGDSAVVNVKGFIRVISPKKGYSECIISKDDPDSPLVPGDNITNAAFRAARNYNFVVKGLFDLHGLGHATRSGRREVEQIITKFGGKVVGEIDFMTDYIVVGVEPKTPPQPESDATESVQEAYKRQKKQYDDYQAIFTEAKKIGIPVLSQNRFLIFTGYMPEKEEE
jgi:hypothetical protein